METALYKTGSLCFRLYVPKDRNSLVELHVGLFCCQNDINGRMGKVAYNEDGLLQGHLQLWSLFPVWDSVSVS